MPSFKKTGTTSSKEKGVTIYYTAQCPFAVGVLEELRKVAEAKSVPFHAYRLTTREAAQNAPAIWTTFGLFYHGEFITHEIMSATNLKNY